MALPPFLQRKQSARAGKPPAPLPASADDVAQARTRARRRLIGAAVLLGAGVIAFPLLFETQPRPIPVDLPIEIPRKDQAEPLPAPSRTPRAPAATAPLPAPTLASPPAARPAAETPAASTAPTGPVAVPAEPAKAGAASAAAPAVAASKPAPKAAADDAARARALLEGKPDPRAAVSAASADDGGSRYVVQIGAYAETEAVRETRAKVEKLGFKTYTQDVDTPAGKRTRVRIGPFATRDEAAQALARLKSAQLGGAVLAL
jgi:DedD protein